MPVVLDLAWSEALMGYDFGPRHPMGPLRLGLTLRLAEDLGLLRDPSVRVVGCAPADDDLLATVHEPAYVAAVRAASARGVPDPARGLGTEDDPLFAGMHEAAAAIVGGSVAVARSVWAGEALHGLNIAGGMHHAMPGRAAGFCVYNDAAVAIRALLASGARRVAYLDLDAHHGDGVERVFWDEPAVLTVSVHESGRGMFPGTGFADETGGPGARGTAVNVALPGRTGDAAWLRAIDAVAGPLLEAFAPDIVVSQHGCDPHGADPLATLAVSVDAQRRADELVHGWAHRVCGGRWVALGGGGYAVADVVPRAWAHLIGVASHAPVAPQERLPEQWLDDRDATCGGGEATSMSDDGVAAFRAWADGHDEDDPVDRAIAETRRAVFPLHGLDPDAGPEVGPHAGPDAGQNLGVARRARPDR